MDESMRLSRCWRRAFRYHGIGRLRRLNRLPKMGVLTANDMHRRVLIILAMEGRIIAAGRFGLTLSLKLLCRVAAEAQAEKGRF